MAEPVGLVIGGLGLLGLFDSCMNAFEYVETGRQYGQVYQRSAFQINLLRLRLSRWKESVDIREDLSGLSNNVQVASPDEVDTVKDLLGNIHYDMQTAENTSCRYKLKQPPPAEEGTEATTIDALSNRVRRLALSRQKDSSFSQKTRWALHDKTKLGNLISELHANVTALVELFPATLTRQENLAVTDVRDLVEPAGIEEPEEAVAVLRETSEGVDAQIAAAIEQLAAASAGGYSFRRMGLDGTAKAQYGTHFADGQYRPGYKAHAAFVDVYAKGNTRAHYGDKFGGTNVLDDDNSMPFHTQVHGYTGAGAQEPGQQMQGYDGGGYGGGGWQRRN